MNIKVVQFYKKWQKMRKKLKKWQKFKKMTKNEKKSRKKVSIFWTKIGKFFGIKKIDFRKIRKFWPFSRHFHWKKAKKWHFLAFFWQKGASSITFWKNVLPKTAQIFHFFKKLNSGILELQNLQKMQLFSETSFFGDPKFGYFLKSINF